MFDFATSTSPLRSLRLENAANALASELPLLPWPALRALLSGRLATAALARCDQIAATVEIEPRALALAATARAA